MNETFRNRVEERLRANKMSQRDLARELNVSEVTVSRWLSGERNPTVETLESMAKVLKTTPSYFFLDDSERISAQKQSSEHGKMNTGLIVTFAVILGLVIAAVAAGILSKEEKDQLVDILKKDDAENVSRR